MEQTLSPLVLIVDDDQISARMMKSVLEREGYRVDTAASGALGIEKARLVRPSVILLDIVMPDENGFDVIEQFKSLPQTANVPVIFTTGAEDVQSKVTAFDLGAVDYLVKPIQIEELKARIRVHLRLARAIQASITIQEERLKTLKEAQQSLLIDPASAPHARFSVYYRPLNEVGGDLYDVLTLGEGICAYFVCDVSGHDLGTSLATASVKALLKDNCQLDTEPRESMSLINRVLTGVLPTNTYITACYAVLNRQCNRLTVVNMGHPLILHVPKNGPAVFLQARGMALGFTDAIAYTSLTVPVSPGDRLLLYTDGLVEIGEESLMWPRAAQRLLTLAGVVRSTPLDLVAHALYSSSFGENDQPHDDVVILVVEV